MTDKTKFIDDNFLLNNKFAEKLFHEAASSLPIIDYHNHLDPKQLAKNHKFSNIYQLWLEADPYKHRAMRINGVPEYFITGGATNKEKFFKWAETIPALLGNPLFHWSCMELKNFFGIDDILCVENAENIWNECNEKLTSGDMGALDLLAGHNIEMLCTSDDVLGDLGSHQQVERIKVCPSLRGDSLVRIEAADFPSVLEQLAEMTGIEIVSLEAYKAAIAERLKSFDAAGCVLADHSLDDGFQFIFSDEAEIAGLFKKHLALKELARDELLKVQTSILCFLAGEYAKSGWIMQLHMGALRNTSTRLRKLCGPAGGYAAIGAIPPLAALTEFLNRLEQEERLPKTILYTLNPAYNERLAVLTGSFTEDKIAGKIQFGPAWWLNDHFAGIRQHFKTLANYSLLSCFVGMTTDSRSVLSFSRHEYFRRILCNMLGEWAEQGAVPNDYSLLKELVEKVSYKNIKNYLNKRA